MEGKLPFSTRGFSTLWKGRWNDSPVAIKMLRLGPEDDKIKIAAVSRKLGGGWPLTPTIAPEILQGSSSVAPPPSPKRTSCLWFLVVYLSIRYNITVDGERKHP